MFKKFAVLAVIVSLLVFAAMPAFAGTASGVDPAFDSARVESTKAIQDVIRNLVAPGEVGSAWNAAGVPKLSDGRELAYRYHAFVFSPGSTALMPVYADSQENYFLMIKPYVWINSSEAEYSFPKVYYSWEWASAPYAGEFRFGETVLPAEFIAINDTQNIKPVYKYIDTPLGKYLESLAEGPIFFYARNAIHFE
ncbi:MAG: hypothetical protein HPY89_00750 [Pelotomaculum sp.]|nr:hypothetical protein [Pelotomaculum sp.]